MKDKKSILTPDAYYHIYNRANGKERLFAIDENYHYFLRKYKERLSPIADTFCYCLMPNHFHFLVRIKEEEVLKDYFVRAKPDRDLTGFQNLSGLLSTLLVNTYLQG